MSLIEFDILRICIALGMFAFAAFFDIRNRSVSDIVWIISGITAGIMYIFDPPADNTETSLIIISILVTTAISITIFKIGLFGAADALALFILALIIPVFDNPILSQNISPFYNLAPLAVLLNAISLSTLQIFLNLLKNILYVFTYPGRLFEGLEDEPAYKKILAIIVGHKSISQDPKYTFSIEKTANGRKRFDFALKPAETEEYAIGQNVWVSPGIPFILYLMAGFIILILFGDILTVIFNLK